MRSVLITPSADARACGCGADALIVEGGAPALAGAPAIYFRVNDLAAPGALDALAAAAALRPRGVALAGALGGRDVQRLGARLAVEEAMLGLPEGTFRVIAFATDSAEAVFGLPSYRGASSRLEALIWSASPLDLSLRASPARRAAPQGPFRLARNLALIAARAAGTLALDAPYPDPDDLVGLRQEALEARADGFDGKAAIHPAQIAVINEVFGA